MIGLKDSIKKIKELKSIYYFKRKTEISELSDSINRELSETIFANSMSPEFDISAMDGYALCSEDKYPLKISGKIYAGDRMSKIKRGEAFAIATGAFMPEGSDAVLKIEDSEVKDFYLYGKSLKKYENVFCKGSDYKKGDTIFEKNHRIMPQSAALLYSLGIEKVPVYKKIKAGIISTGTEIHNGMIKNTSAVLIHGAMKEFGCESEFIGTVPDDYEKTKNTILSATGNYDVIFTTGGVSVGERDYVADIIEKTGKLIFHKVALRPGKPLAVGVINDTLIFGLPGKPTGCFAALEVVLRNYFTNISRAYNEFMINEDVVISEKGFDYILFVKTLNGCAFMNSKKDISIISASPRSSIVDGYVITDKNIKKGENIKVYLFG